MARYDFCPQCGTANANGDFCINCGASLVTSDDVVDRDAPAPTVPIPVVPTPQGYLDENGRPVGVQPSGERGPQGDAPRRGVSKKLIIDEEKNRKTNVGLDSEAWISVQDKLIDFVADMS